MNGTLIYNKDQYEYVFSLPQVQGLIIRVYESEIGTMYQLPLLNKLLLGHACVTDVFRSTRYSSVTSSLLDELMVVHVLSHCTRYRMRLG